MVEMLYKKRMCCEYLLNVSECVALLGKGWETERNRDGERGGAGRSGPKKSARKAEAK